MEEKILAFRDSHFTFEGVMQQIQHWMLGDGDLRCQRLPKRTNWFAESEKRKEKGIWLL